MDELNQLEFFLVRSQDGKWFRSKGYGGYGDNWVSEIKKARVYNRIGPARACVSYYATHYPSYKTPQIIKCTIGNYDIIDEAERIQKVKDRKKKAEETRELRRKEYALKQAQKEYELAEQRLKAHLKKK